MPQSFDLCSEEIQKYIRIVEGVYEETFFDVWINCISPSVYSIFLTIYKVVLVNLCFGVIVSTGRISQTEYHILSGSSGLFLISCLESTKGKILMVVFFSLSYFLLHLGCVIQNKYDPILKSNTNKIRYLSNSNVVKYTLITALVLCEYYLLETSTWQEIRGIFMVFTMKLISLAEDMDSSITIFPTFYQFFGYIFCGANVMFGPWITFQEYSILYRRPTKKNVWWICGILRAVVLCVLFLVISNCLAEYFISNPNRFIVGYKEALAFRTSHYFICYLSEAGMLAAGFKNYKIWYENKKWQFFITNPLKIEMPNSLATVVTNWNRPMHEFLKKYIYKSWLPLGKFYGILATFIISSFLHGFEIKVSLVLITIGIFSYLQYAARDHLAYAFDCCIRVYPCKQTCNHKYKRNSIVCTISLLVLSLFTILHLIYLGVLMDPSTEKVGIYEKWNNLSFASLWIMVVNVLIII